MIIYHGSKRVIDKPIPNGSNEENDYGPSFYLTTDLNKAKMWACKYDSLGVVNKYFIPNTSFNNLKVLDLTDKSKYSVLNWLAILVHFKSIDQSFRNTYKSAIEVLSKYYIDVNDYDVVVGYRADDSYFRFPLSFISSVLSLEDLEEIYISGDLGLQLAFMSERAINQLRFKGTIECEDSYIGQYYKLVQEATQKFKEITNKPIQFEDKTFMFDIVRKENEGK